MGKRYADMNADERKAELKRLEAKLEEVRARGLKLNMTRGRPGSGQLDQVNDLITILSQEDHLSEDGSDCRNYGGLTGIPEIRRAFAEVLGIDAANLIVQDNSSLNIMYTLILHALTFGVPGGDAPWGQNPKRAFLCPAPGYDRHFAITEHLGFDLITVPMTATGPNMDMVEKLVAGNANIKGIWTVPVYSNPDGIVYSEETCRRLATMKTAAPDFRIIWDNAYVVHHLYPDQPELCGSVPEILALCAEAGHPDRVLQVASFSKVTFPGSAPACLAASKTNLDWYLGHIQFRTISPNKMMQLAHVRFLEKRGGIANVMRGHADVLRPRFEMVLKILRENLADSGLAEWHEPKGGYFISVNLRPGLAQATVNLAKQLGVAFTPAGATYPRNNDPSDSNIRLAPTLPTTDELKTAIEVFCLCVRYCALTEGNAK
ncbi:MAG: aminotransferase class I/II-fold pyridoxal phosphate-dependent enzyme [Clostridiaceae bacterium]|nr:aminotransferase class I/II-fold pyridoxal phosphate-dependent enzyme [Clostridiaceae bacterium]